jgi:DNA gyrase inhibitor GyrI
MMAAPQKVHPLTKEIIPPRTCVGILHRGPYNEIGAAFGRLFGQLHSGAVVPPDGAGGGQTLGLYMNHCPETTKPEDLRSYAAVDITSSFAAGAKDWWPSDWEVIKVAGGPAAVMTVNGSYDQLGTAWKSFNERIKEQGWKMSDNPALIDHEVYLEMDEKDSSKNVTKLVVFLED